MPQHPLSSGIFTESHAQNMCWEEELPCSRELTLPGSGPICTHHHNPILLHGDAEEEN